MLTRTARTCILLACVLAVASVPAMAMLEKTDGPSPVHISEISSCPPIQRLNAIKDAQEAAEGESALARAFGHAFPFEDPGHNALLATFYISSFPNLILAFIPADIDTASLNTMIAFATGGLLGDTLLNLIPHSFFGEPSPTAEGVQVVVVSKERNIVVSLAIFGGFALFFCLDKGFRYLSARYSPESQGHSHSHSHSDSHDTSVGQSSAIEGKGSESKLKQRNGARDVLDATNDAVEVAKTNRSRSVEANRQAVEDEKARRSKSVGAVLNLLSDFSHNITDGLAMSSAFYASRSIGSTTALACFAHEIPHEIADYSILIKSGGFTKWQAMGCQFITAAGAFLGTILGIWIQRSVGGAVSVAEEDLTLSVLNKAHGILGTSVTGAELVVPAVAGSFFFVVATVLPELLEDSSSGKETLKQIVAMLVGITCMAVLAWYE